VFSFLKKCLKRNFLFWLTLGLSFFSFKSSYSYPIYAQNSYENPREAEGRLVCANCHLAEALIGVESPQSVLLDSVFETVVSIPYAKMIQQISSTGVRSSLNVGAVVVLPEYFRLAPKDRLSFFSREKLEGVYIYPYRKESVNIFVLGPLQGDSYRELSLPILTPGLVQGESFNFFKNPIYVGGNRGRGQIYPSGEKSNVNAVTNKVPGRIISIEATEGGKQIFKIRSFNDYNIVSEAVERGFNVTVKVNDDILDDSILTLDPNVGGFGQLEKEVVLQDFNRVKGLIACCFTVVGAQVLFVLKKKQFSKVQSAEMLF
jgi:apocytochrome f